MAIGAPPIQIQKKKRGFGCFGCGCAIAIVLLLLFVGFFVAGGYTLYHRAIDLTDPAAAPVPQSTSSDDVYTGASQKVTQFENAFESRQPASLHLSADEINALIARDPNFTNLRGHFFVSLQGSEATVQCDVQLGTYENVVLADRYFHGNVAFGVSVDPDTHSLLFDIHGMQIKDQPVPPSSAQSLSQVVNQTVNQKLQQNQIARDFIARVTKLDIENNELVIEIK